MLDLLNIRESILKIYLNKKFSPNRMIRYLKKKNIKRSENLDKIDKNLLTLAAIQMRAEPVNKVETYLDKIYDFIKTAVKNKAQLIVFPEDILTPLFGVIPQIKDLFEKKNREKIGDKHFGNIEEVISKSFEENVKIIDILKFISPYFKNIFLKVFPFLSKSFGVYIITGSAMLETDNGKVKNIAYLCGPDGNILGNQEKCHLFLYEDEWGINPGNDINVFSTEIGNIAFPICMDATYFETFRIAYLKGADIIGIPIANPEKYNIWKASRGIWSRVQETPCYGVSSCLVGKFMGLTLTGKSGVFAPLELTLNSDGIISQAKTFDQEEVVIAKVSIPKLYKYRKEIKFNERLNKKIYQKYFPDIYLSSKKS
jgi:predicted amidohydrolase